MFFLHASNKTENLLHHLAALIKADPLQSIFEKEYIVIQSQGMERMISQSMAYHLTSWCNYAFLLPVRFLQDIAARLGMEITPDSYDRNCLCWRIEKELRNIDDSVFTPLQRYIGGEKEGLRRYQLARQLANIFDQYQLMRPEMLKSWESEKICTNEKAESWQMSLWNKLINSDVESQHRGAMLQAVTEKLNSQSTNQFPGRLPKRVAFFGLHILPPFFLDYLSGLAKHCDVHLFQLSPCRNYWGDMYRRKGNILVEHEESSHPLLLSLGKQGRDFHELLLEKVAFEQEITSYDEPYKKENPKVLHKLQSDLLAGCIQTLTPEMVSDQSIRVVSCHSKLRELAVLKDHLLEILNNNETLQLRDIVVMAPDIQEYAPFIPAVFEEIQHSIADRTLQRKNSYISVFRHFLDLFQGRFGWSELLDILENELISPNFGISSSDFGQVKNWVISAGIRWGLSADSRKDAGFSFSSNSWKSGLERMLMGYAIDTDTQVFGVLPYSEIEGGDAKILGGLCEFVHIIIDGQRDFTIGYELPEWSHLLIKYAESLFTVKDDKDYLELIAVILELQEYGEHHSGSLDLDVITSWFDHIFSESRSASGFLKGHLTFCSMLPMRSIPFKALCLIGLNYGIFPKNDYQATFDLMRQHPIKGDRSHRADDRYQFLEAILSARDSLYLSYIGQSLQNNESIPPSVVVTELLEVLQDHYHITDVVEKQPLHGFNRDYFTKGSRLFSYSEENCNIASNLLRSRQTDEQWWSGKIAFTDDTIQVDELFRFYSNPQRYFVSKCLGIPENGERSLPDETENFETGGLDGYLADQLILDTILQKKSLEDVQNQLTHNGIWPLAAPGDLVFKEKVAELEAFAEQVEMLDMGECLQSAEIDLKVGGYRLQGQLKNIHENGIFLMRYGKFQGRDLLAGWLHHLLNLACLPIPSVTMVLMRDNHVRFTDESQPGPDLEELITTYVEGCKQPSYLLVKPGIEYCRQKLSKRAKVSPLEKAKIFIQHNS